MDSLGRHERVLALSRLVDRWAEDHLAAEPDWEPLEKAIPRDWCGGFMWMQRVDEHDTTIELYKHGITRRYLNLDSDAQTYRYTGSGYIPIGLEEALDWVFEGLEEMGWTRDTVYDDDFVAKKYAALREAGWTVITTGSPAPLGSTECSDDEDEDSDHHDSHENRRDERRL